MVYNSWKQVGFSAVLLVRQIYRHWEFCEFWKTCIWLCSRLRRSMLWLTLPWIIPLSILVSLSDSFLPKTSFYVTVDKKQLTIEKMNLSLPGFAIICSLTWKIYSLSVGCNHFKDWLMDLFTHRPLCLVTWVWEVCSLHHHLSVSRSVTLKLSNTTGCFICKAKTYKFNSTMKMNQE